MTTGTSEANQGIRGGRLILSSKLVQSEDEISKMVILIYLPMNLILLFINICPQKWGGGS